MNSELSKERIYLRDFALTDARAYLSLKDPDRKHWDFNGPYFTRPSRQATVERIDNYLTNIRSGITPAMCDRMLVCDKTNDSIIGEVNWYWKSQETNWMEIGVVIFDDANWSKGIGYEALRQWINKIFIDHPELIRIGLSTWSGNIGMIKLAKKLGMTEEARYKNARIVNGRYFDSLSYGIQREEWVLK